jgi:hypothetical protein
MLPEMEVAMPVQRHEGANLIEEKTLLGMFAYVKNLVKTDK